MVDVDLSEYSLKLVKQSGVVKVFDPVRKKYFIVTPEEVVRQKMLLYLIQSKGYSPSLIGVEKQLKLKQVMKRTDIVVFKSDMQPYIVIECKAPQINITSDICDQVIRYNQALGADYILVSNGFNHLCCKFDSITGMYNPINYIPQYE